MGGADVIHLWKIKRSKRKVKVPRSLFAVWCFFCVTLEIPGIKWSPGMNHLSVVPLSTVPENFIKIHSHLFIFSVILGENEVMNAAYHVTSAHQQCVVITRTSSPGPAAQYLSAIIFRWRLMGHAAKWLTAYSLPIESCFSVTMWQSSFWQISPQKWTGITWVMIFNEETRAEGVMLDQAKWLSGLMESQESTRHCLLYLS